MSRLEQDEMVVGFPEEQCEQNRLQWIEVLFVLQDIGKTTAVYSGAVLDILILEAIGFDIVTSDYCCWVFRYFHIVLR